MAVVVMMPCPRGVAKFFLLFRGTHHRSRSQRRCWLSPTDQRRERVLPSEISDVLRPSRFTEGISTPGGILETRVLEDLRPEWVACRQSIPYHANGGELHPIEKCASQETQ
jgi:hypothetical protein